MLRDGESGVTLVEVMVALALFSLIGTAGFSVADAVLKAQRHTDGRLERLGRIQRAMHLMTLDLEQVADRDMIFEDGALTFRRFTPRGTVGMAYRSDGGTLLRAVDGQAAQTLLRDAGAVRWRFHHAESGWIDIWPPPPTGRPGQQQGPSLPDAVAAEIMLGGDGLSGPLRRVVRLPEGGR